MWSSPMTMSLDPIIVTALWVGFSGKSLELATGGLAYNCPLAEALTTGAYCTQHNIACKYAPCVVCCTHGTHNASLRCKYVLYFILNMRSTHICRIAYNFSTNSKQSTQYYTKHTAHNQLKVRIVHKHKIYAVHMLKLHTRHTQYTTQ